MSSHTTEQLRSNVTIPFVKYHGTGNDFIMIDNRAGRFSAYRNDATLLRNMCHRRFGVGADGIMELVPAAAAERTFDTRYYNADGRLGTFCGNGARCAVRFAKDLGLLVYNEARFMFCGKVYHGVYDVINDHVHIKVGDVSGITKCDERDFFVNTGSPHYIRFVDSVSDYDVITDGKAIRHSAEYEHSGGTNANFVQLDVGCDVIIRTYERGVEDETWACGSGSVAAALVHAHAHCAGDERPRCERGGCQHGAIRHCHVTTQGGGLIVTYETLDYHVFTDVYLIGPAKKTFAGTYAID